MAKTESKVPVQKEKPRAPATREAWAPFDSLRREVDRLFEDFRPFGWRLPSAQLDFDLDLPKGMRAAWDVVPAIDLVEKDGGYDISAELPGLDEKDVEVKVSNGTLSIRGEKSEEKEESEKDYHLSERRYGAFQRAFRIPEGVDVDKIEASFAKGVLKVKLPKSVQAKNQSKKIPVKAA